MFDDLLLYGRTDCDDAAESEHIHDLKEYEEIKSTCTDFGNIAYWRCEDCGKYFSDSDGSQEIDALSVLVAPTGHEHGLVIDDRVEPTCTSDGKTAGVHCERCNAVLIEQVRIPKLAHVPGEWIVDQEASCRSTGNQHTECVECGTVVETSVIPKLAHEYVNRVCTNCGDLDESKGLQFELDDQGFYQVTGIGSCLDDVLIIPDSYNGKAVTGIAPDAFKGCTQIQTLIIPDSVIEIGDSAFEDCINLQSIQLPDSLQNIGMLAFSNCSIQSLQIPSSIKYWGMASFQDCHKLERVVIPEGVQKIVDSAFSRCERLSTVVIPDTVTEIEKLAFRGCVSLTEVYLPDSLENIGASAFEECGLTTLTVPSAVRQIGQSAFYLCKDLESIQLPDNLSLIGASAFNSCYSLRNITIPSAVTKIERYTFFACKQLSTIALPASLTSIGSYAFASCDELSSITIPASVTRIDNNAFSADNKLQQVIFEETQGWHYSTAPEEVEIFDIDETLLRDSASAAECLSSLYVDYYWQRG